jgi:hypothetical protein
VLVSGCVVKLLPSRAEKARRSRGKTTSLKVRLDRAEEATVFFTVFRCFKKHESYVTAEYFIEV